MLGHWTDNQNTEGYRFGDNLTGINSEDIYKRMAELGVEPLPFDDIPQAVDESHPKRPFYMWGDGNQDAFLKKLEEYEPKERLMLYYLLDNVGIRAGAVKEADYRIRWTDAKVTEWQAWKQAICEVTGKSWEEIAPIIYEGYL